MNLDKIIQNNGLIDFYFFVLIDMYNEIHCGEDLEEIKEKVLHYYKDDLSKLDHGDDNAKKIKDFLDSIKEDDLEKIEIKIKKPNYAENNLIITNSTTIDVGTGLPVLNAIEYYRQRILHLLKDWNIEKNGKKAPIDIVTIGSLHPYITDYITNIINNNVAHYISSIK